MDKTNPTNDVSEKVFERSDSNMPSEVEDKDINAKVSFSVPTENQSDHEIEISSVELPSQRYLHPSFVVYQTLISNQDYDIRLIERDEISDNDRAIRKTLQPGRHLRSIRKQRTIYDYYFGYFLRVKAFAELMMSLSFIWYSLAILVFSCVITYHHSGTIDTADRENQKNENQKLVAFNDAVKTTISFIVLLIVFENSSAYKHWWKGRSYWGQLTCNITQVARQACTWIRDEQLKDRFVSYCITLPYACKAVLRGHDFNHPWEEGKYLVKYNLISTEELEHFRKDKLSFDLACLDMIWEVFNKCISDPDALISNDKDLIQVFSETMEKRISSVQSAVGSLHELKDTGLPPTYRSTMYFGIFCVTVFSSFIHSARNAWVTPIYTALLSMIMVILIVISDGMRNCFDLNLTSLPLQQFCVSIEKEIIDIFNRSRQNSRLLDEQKSPKN